MFASEDNHFVLNHIKNDFFLLKQNYGFSANILLCVCKDYLLLCDSGFPQIARETKDLLTEKFNKPVKVILNSHDHSDHTGMNWLLKEDAAVYMHTNSVAHFNFKKIIRVDKPMRIFWSEPIQLIPSEGGHSRSDLVIYFTKSNIFYLGDLYLSESFPLIAGRENSVRVLIRRLQSVLDTADSESILVPGHGDIKGCDDLNNYIQMLNRTITIVMNYIHSGKSKEQAKKEDILKNYSQWGKYFDFIKKETWIDQIVRNYK